VKFDVGTVEIFHHPREDFGFSAEKLVEYCIDIVFDGDKRFDFKSGGESDFIDSEDVERIDHGDQESVALTLHRQSFESPCVLGTDEVNRFFLWGDFGDIGERNAPHFAETSDSVTF